MKKVFLDTNVFIDFLAHRGVFYEPAALIVSLGMQNKVRLQVSSLSFATASYILSRHNKWDSRRIEREFKAFISLCGITIVDEKTVKQAVSAQFDDFEDGLQHFSALASGSDVIITRNTNDFDKSQIPVMEPNLFLDIWEQEH
ncbi:MAG: PIN domain-containing protein [Prevotella sp.]|nr:PIN domain-containing protein [Prevotella sp.]MBQ9186654.1 PIN domain-containing protein [Prevotella sp.]